MDTQTPSHPDRRTRFQPSQRGGSVRRMAAAVLAAVLGAAALVGLQAPAPARSATACANGDMNIVAHTDDDLLFLSPDFMRDLEVDRCSLTVFTTAGEAGEGASYWQSLEAGIQATYAQMAGKANSWVDIDDGIANRDIARWQLSGSNIQVMFLRIPDGFPDGSGSDTYNYQSILKLWNGTLSSVTPVDGRAAYTKSQLASILLQTMQSFKPTTLRTQDWTGSYTNPYDHSDHWATAKFAQQASASYTAPHTLTGYDAYVIDEYAQNVFDPELTKKVDAFVTFAGYDHNVCNSPGEGCPDSPYNEWLKREYPTAIQWTKNAAKDSGTTVQASSQASSTQSPDRARDGYAWGAPQAPGKEWVSNGEKTGAWIQYTFGSPTAVSMVNLFDRPLADQQVTSGVLDFSDGTSVPVGALYNNGAGTTVTFPGRTVTSVKFTVTGVSPSTTAAGLAEFEVFKGADTTAPVITATPPGGAYPSGQTVTLSSNEPSTTIRYTTDGSTPTATSPTYTSPIPIGSGLTLKYFGKDAAGNSSAVATQTYTLADDKTPPTVTADPVGGAYPAGTQIKLTANEPATIRYTTDGSDPVTAGTTYTGPISLDAAMTLKYFATDSAGNASAVAQQVYTIAADTTPPTITANPVGGTYPSGQQITLSSNEGNTAIYYTTDGSTPTTASTPYTGPLTLTQTFTLSYFGKDLAGNTSTVQSQTYTLQPKPVTPSWHDYTGDGYADVLAADGDLLKLYKGDGAGGIAAGVQVATGWSGMNATMTPGDFNGDGKNDVLARRTSDGALFLYPGNGSGGFGTRVQVGWGWNVMTAVLSPGDFDGDGNSDVLARDSGGALWLYPGDGTGGWKSRVQVGWGWNVMNAIVSGRDFNGDGKNDVIARDTNGTLWLYPGDGANGWLSRSQIATGWGSMTAIAAPGDLTGDAKTDIIARDGSGVLWLYPGTGTGGIDVNGRTQLATGWGALKFIS
ncbi:chitobiase/beta-hexosaminidase C-terminal domain-containing protein [Sinomonas sp. R1AF57]|uniref:chitobiase/beta-hexosaminidase C-terminal domain-containing protein n=1 Tax=Sinomonas sp. R1AF57 TaxID=2020377 RepID=UPI001ABF1945|nr:chitobiase/beta-hexosaminidase C-terminal domain-containing protein [Sinomonas sp. R1AF57]